MLGYNLGFTRKRGGDKGIAFVGGMAVGYVGGTATVNLNIVLNGGTETTPSEGDLIIVVVGSNYTTALGVTGDAFLPTGYTQLRYDASSDTRVAKSRLCYRISDGTETTISIPGGTNDIDAAGSTSVLVFRGVNISSPFDVVSAPVATPNSRDAFPPAITTVSKSSALVVVGVTASNSGYLYYSSADMEYLISKSGNDTEDCLTGMGYKMIATPGLYSPAGLLVGAANSADSSLGYSLALKPA